MISSRRDQLKFKPLYGPGYHWGTRTISLRYNPTGEPAVVAGQMPALIQSAAAKWNAQCGINLVYGGTTNTPASGADNPVVIGWWFIPGGYGALSHLRINPDASGNLALDGAAIALNNDIAVTVAHTKYLLLHELGHVLGIGHSQVPNAVMSGPPDTNYYTSATTLAADDVAACRAFYVPAATCSTPQPADETSTGACSSAETGHVTYARSYACNNGTWLPGAWNLTASTCVTPSAPPPAPSRPNAPAVEALPAATLLLKEYQRPATDDYFVTGIVAEQQALETGIDLRLASDRRDLCCMGGPGGSTIARLLHRTRLPFLWRRDAGYALLDRLGRGVRHRASEVPGVETGRTAGVPHCCAHRQRHLPRRNRGGHALLSPDRRSRAPVRDESGDGYGHGQCRLDQ